MPFELVRPGTSDPFLTLKLAKRRGVVKKEHLLVNSGAVYRDGPFLFI